MLDVRTSGVSTWISEPRTLSTRTQNYRFHVRLNCSLLTAHCPLLTAHCSLCISSSSCHPFSCRPSYRLSYRPFSMTSYFLFCRDRNRSSYRRPIPCSLWPRRGFQLPSWTLLSSRSLLQCVQLYVSVCRCNYLCLL